jgi:glycosyltransferase involved in cell wall biosynthesis
MSHTMSILTATYNRADTLPRLYRSLIEGATTEASIEWIIVDDGSTDETGAWIQGVVREGRVRVVSKRQANAGRGAALNECVALMSGRYAMLMDSDDWFAPGALRSIADQIDWLDGHPEIAGAVGNCIATDGRVIGTHFRPGREVATFQTVYDGDRVRGDKKEVIRSEVMRAAFPFPVFDGERRVATALIWRRIGRRHSCRFVNKPWVVKEYRADGLTRNSAKVRAESPRSSCVYYAEVLDEDANAPMLTKARAAINYARYRFHARWRGVAEPPVRSLWPRALNIIGWGLARWDRAVTG